MLQPDASFIVLDTVDSTNNYAMAKVHAGLAKHGQGYFCGLQTAGKGQRGKQWQTAEGVNIALSLILDVQLLNIAQQFPLLVAVALGCHDFFSRLAGEETTIKWPNDIYWRDRKAGGVLIENNFQGKDWKYAVVGIGVNINQTHFDSQLKKPVSLRQITGKDWDTISLAKELHQCVLHRFDAMQTAPFALSLATYNHHLFGRDKKMRLRKGTIQFDTTVKAVTAFGQLVTQDTLERQFDFGEVEWII